MSSDETVSPDPSDPFSSRFEITEPAATVTGPNVRANWSTEGHLKGTTYGYVVGKKEQCGAPVYQGEDLPGGQVALRLEPGTYYICVTRKHRDRTRPAANSPLKFEVK